MSVEKWLSSLRSESTKRVYLAGLNDFTRSVLGNEDFDKTIAQYLTKIQDGHDAFKDLLTYATSLTDAKTPPTTANAYMAGVKRFLEFAVDYDLSRGHARALLFCACMHIPIRIISHSNALSTVNLPSLLFAYHS